MAYKVEFEISADIKQAVTNANKLVGEISNAAKKADFGKTKIDGLPGTLAEAAKNAELAQEMSA